MFTSYNPGILNQLVDIESMADDLTSTGAQLSQLFSGRWLSGVKNPVVPFADEFSIGTGSLGLGASISIVDSSSTQKLLYFTNRFFLIGLTRSYREKTQILETLGKATFSFFGQSALVYQLQCVALDKPGLMPNERWEGMHFTGFHQFYKEHLRASQLAKENRLAVLKVNNHLVYGYPLDLSGVQTGDQDNFVQFTMQWLVADHISTTEDVSEEALAQGYSVDYLISKELTQQREFRAIIEKREEAKRKIEAIKTATTLTSGEEPRSILNLTGRVIYDIRVETFSEAEKQELTSKQEEVLELAKEFGYNPVRLVSLPKVEEFTFAISYLRQLKNNLERELIP